MGGYALIFRHQRYVIFVVEMTFKGNSRSYTITQFDKKKSYMTSYSVPYATFIIFEM